MAGKTIRIGSARAKAFVAGALIKAGLDAKQAEAAAESLVRADRRGVFSHGCLRMPLYTRRLEAGLVKTRPEIRVIRERTATALIDADLSLGLAAGVWAMERAMDGARRHGLSLVCLRHATHYGMASNYTLLAAQAGLIGYTMTNTAPRVAPWGSADRLLGTNPLAVSIPRRQDFPLTLDMSTSIVAVGKISVALNKGEAIPDNWGVDAEGNPTTDPQALLKGALHPIAGPKGSGLGLMIDILSGVLGGSTFGPNVGSMMVDFSRPDDVGQVFAALDPGAFDEPDSFYDRLEELVRRIKSSRPAKGFAEVLLPGEPEHRAEQDALANGIPYAEELLAELNKWAAERGLGILT